MPSSFSRFLNAEELERVRELYFESLQDEDKPDEAAVDTKPESSDAAPQRDEGDR